MFELSHFFGTRVTEPLDIPEPQLTFQYLPERSETGVVIVAKCVEHELDSLHGMNFEDYRINSLLAAGIPLKSIKLSSDCRIGSDKDIKAFNERVDALAEQLFNS